MGVSILDRLNKRNGTADHTIAGALKSYIIRNGGDPTGLQSISDLVEALPESGGSDSAAPAGSISITENDTYDVSQYATAVVNVPGSGSTNMLTIRGTGTDASELPDNFPTGSFSVAAIEEGRLSPVLVLTEVTEYDGSDPTDHVSIQYPQRMSGGKAYFGESYGGEVAVLQLGVHGTISLTEWRDDYNEADIGDDVSYSYYDYLKGDIFDYRPEDEYYQYERDGEYPYTNHSVTWILYLFTNSAT